MFILLCHWNQGNYPDLKRIYAIPNGGNRNIVTAKNLKDEGVRSGVPDLCLPVARGGFFGWYGELKRVRSGRLSKEQSEELFALTRDGYWAKSYHGAYAMWEDIQQYLNLPLTQKGITVGMEVIDGRS